MKQWEYVIWQIAQKAQEKGENKWQFCWHLAESTQPSPTDNSWVCTGSWKQNLLPTKKLSGVMSWFLITNSKWINHLLLLMLFVSSWLPENKNPMTLRSWERLKITPFTSESQNWNLRNVFEGRPFHIEIIKSFLRKIWYLEYNLWQNC